MSEAQEADVPSGREMSRLSPQGGGTRGTPDLSPPLSRTLS